MECGWMTSRPQSSSTNGECTETPVLLHVPVQVFECFCSCLLTSPLSKTLPLYFKCRYYEELLVRAWRLRDPDNSDPQGDLSVHIGKSRQDWTWAGPNGGNPRFMLNADLCLAFDIDVVTDCCARIREGGAVPGEGKPGCISEDIFSMPAS